MRLQLLSKQWTVVQQLHKLLVCHPLLAIHQILQSRFFVHRGRAEVGVAIVIPGGLPEGWQVHPPAESDSGLLRPWFVSAAAAVAAVRRPLPWGYCARPSSPKARCGRAAPTGLAKTHIPVGHQRCIVTTPTSTTWWCF